ncbi:ATP synthase subunit I [Pseudomonas sp. TMP9]|uniref:ATP synthase subunit I n=1 Tax=Pseudomonas sp. TMP9 TaxID=3133144 RepID=UPI0030CA6566
MIDNPNWLAGIAALLAGGALGTVFFAGLWWTVRRAADSATPATPARWFIASLIVRTAIVLAGFYMVGATQPLRLGLCLLGFVLARVLVLRITRPNPAALAPSASPLHSRGKPPCA